MEEGGALSFLPHYLSWDISSPPALRWGLRYRLPGPQAPRLQPGYTYMAFAEASGLQTADPGAFQPPQSHEPIPHNKSMSLCLLWFCYGSLSLENPIPDSPHLGKASRRGSTQSP